MNGTTSNKTNVFAEYSDHIIVAFSLLLLIYTLWLAFRPGSKSELEILSDFSPVSNQERFYNLEGTIMHDGNPVDTALVWLILKDGNGNERSPVPPSCRTDSKGGFRFDSILVRENALEVDTKKAAGPSLEVSKRDVQEISIHARTKNPEMKGEKIVRVNSGGTRLSKIEKDTVIYLLVIFIISILFPFIIKSYKVKYLSSIITAIFLSGGMIITIALGISFTSTLNKGEIVSLGFAHIAQNNNEWLFCLTSPLNLGQSGFWVPLWVLLLSVIGASLFTVLIIVNQIKDRPVFTKLEKTGGPDADELKKFQETIKDIVLHQFYMIFSPLGSVFVYQLLVIGDAATKPVTVAIAALASGPALNLILDRAINKIEEIISKKINKKADGNNKD